MSFRHAAPFVLLLALGPASGLGQDAADRLVRDSGPLPPSEELAAFKVTDGFEAGLFAGEEQIGGKPINMAFDARGRLWVSSTREYPYAVPKDCWEDSGLRARGSQDSIRILEDIDGDGRADKTTVFADDLNIPTGVLPFQDGCIAWSIPNIVHLRDTDGDGVCDQRKILFGPLGYEKDTHGMISSLRLGLDGWIYATHGFSNTSHFKARDGSTLDLTSGNVFRFRPDGSRVEPWTSGQVNPFGLCWDSWGNLYSADCHSSPIYQLIRGGCYPSFGKPHDGLGFAPVMCQHAHGSTGIAGIVYLDGGVWGPGWNDHMLVGNPVTSKINHDEITLTGSTPLAREKPDFLTSEDPWFRPVDLQLGPDSALYVADFYNRIIGHYEVPLDHPGRDRERGRIWRISRKGFTVGLPETNLDKKSPEQLLNLLDHPNLTLRSLALEALLARIAQVRQGDPTGEKSARFIASIAPASLETGADSPLRCAMWYWLYQRGRFHQNSMTQLWKPSADGMASVHLMRAIGARADQKSLFSLGSATDPRVLAAGLEMVPELPEKAPLDWFVTLRSKLPDGDARLHHAWLLAMRSAMAATHDWSRLPSEKNEAGADAVLFRIAASIPSATAATWMFERLRNQDSPGSLQALGELPPLLLHIARHLPENHRGDLISLVRRLAGDDLELQVQLFTSLREINGGDGTDMNMAFRDWAEWLSRGLIKGIDANTSHGWKDLPSPGTRPWFRQRRTCADGTTAWFLSSLPPGGEWLTGGIRSPEFEIPDKISFWMAGHSGPPPAYPHHKNLVRLVDAENGEVLARTFPPRNDVAQPVVWSFQHQKVDPEKPLAHRRAWLEIIDGDDANAFAWLAVGGFDATIPALPEDDAKTLDQRVKALAQLLTMADSPEAAARLAALPDKTRFTPETRQLLATALAGSNPDLAALAPLAREEDLAPVIFALFAQPAEADRLLRETFNTRPYRTQVRLASAMSTVPVTAARLLELASPRVLADPLVTGKLEALRDTAVTARLASLVKALPPENETLQALLDQRLKAFATAKTDAGHGEQLFSTQCAVCHRIGVRGNLVGPQLDGVGARGAERLLEDILDPNRAVDPAFRLHFVKKKDGGLLAGLLRREQDGVLTYADAAGQEHAVKRQDIAESQESPFSLMPAGFGEILPEQDLHDLLAYLLARKP